MMTYCSNCGSELNGSPKFCTECGYQLDTPAKMTKTTSSQSRPTPTQVWDESKMYEDIYPVYKRKFWPYGILPLITGLFFGAFMLVLNYLINYEITEFDYNIGGWLVLLVVLGGLVGSAAGVVYIYYIYLNFDDFRKLQRTSHQNRINPQPIDPVLAAIGMIVFSMIPIYFKYNHLKIHLEEHHENLDNTLANPITVIIILAVPTIGSILSAISIFFFNELVFIFVAMTILGFVQFYRLDQKWQDNLNSHIEFHKT